MDGDWPRVVVLKDGPTPPYSSASSARGSGTEPMTELEGVPCLDTPDWMDLDTSNNPEIVQNTCHRASEATEVTEPNVDTVPSDLRATRPCRFHYPPEVWDAHKEEIRRLYIEQNLSLPKVMQIMATKGLAGTTKMFKARFTEWGFVKNNRRRDVACMLKIMEQRNASGKKTVFTRNGRPVDIQQYLRRARPLRPSTAPGPDGALPHYLGARSPSPPPRYILPPEDLHFEEVLLTDIQFLASQHYATWNYWEYGSWKYNNEYANSNVFDDIDIISTGAHLISTGDVDGGSKLVRLGFRSLQQIFHSHTFYSLLNLLMVTSGNVDGFVVGEIWRYLAAYSALVLRGAHPLNNILQQLHQLYRTQDFRLATFRMKDFLARLVDLLRCSFDTRDQIFVRLVAIGVYWWGFWLDGSQEAMMLLEDIGSARRAAQDTFGLESRKYYDVTWHQIATIEALKGQRSKELSELSVEILKDLDKFNVRRDHLASLCKRNLALYNIAVWSESDTPAQLDPRHELARQYLEEAIDYNERTFEPSDALYLLNDLSDLQGWQEEAGLTEEARATEKRLDAVLLLISNLPEPET